MRMVFEKVRDSEGASFAFRGVGGPDFACPYHTHPEVELLHIVAGQGHLVVGDHVGRYQADDLMLLGGGLPHMLCSDDPAPSGTATRLRYVQFRPEDFGDRFWRLRELEPLARLLAHSSRGLRFRDLAGAPALDCMDRMEAASGATRLLLMVSALTRLAEATQEQPLASPGYAPSVTHRDSERLDRAMAFIGRHFTEGLSLAQVAAQAGLSLQAFSRFFHKLVGMTYMDYVLALRVSMACRLLLETDHGASEVAFQVGFNNLSNFNRQFKKLKGTTPRDYRKQLPG